MNARERSILQEGRTAGYSLEGLDEDFFFKKEDLYLPGEIVDIISKIDVKIENFLCSLFIRIKETKDFFSICVNGSTINLGVEIIEFEHPQDFSCLFLNKRKAQIVYSPRNKRGRLVIN